MQPTSSITLEQFRELIDFSREKPSWYVQQVLGCNLWEKQNEIVDAVFKYSSVAVKTCNSVGKSYVAARIVMTYLMLHPDSIVVTTAPTWNQVVNVLWREIANTVNMAKYKLTDKEVTQAGLNLDSKWYAVGVSTRTPDNMMGYHADNLLVVVDEAGGVDDLIFQGVRAITTNVNNKVLLIGNPTSPGGVFWNAFEPGSKYKQYTVSAFDTPNFTANGIVTIDRLIEIFTPPEGLDENQQLDHYEHTKKSLKLPFPELIHPGDVYQKYLDWGVDSPAWQSLVLGEFPSQSDQALFPVDLVKQAMNNHGVDDETGKTFAELAGWVIPSGEPEYGLDVARFGTDKTVLTARRGGFVDPYKSTHVWQGFDLIASADRVLAILDKDVYKPIHIKIDDTGTGSGVSDALARYSDQRTLVNQAPYQYRISKYVMSMSPRNKIKFHDITSEIYWNLATWFKNKQIALPYDKELFDELVARRWSITPSGKIKVETKDEYKKRTKGRSPDKSDSLALAFADSLSLNSVQQIDDDREPLTRLTPTAAPVTSGLMSRY